MLFRAKPADLRRYYLICMQKADWMINILRHSEKLNAHILNLKNGRI